MKLLGIFLFPFESEYHSHLFQNNERYLSKYLLIYAFNNIFHVLALTFYCSPDVFAKYRYPQRKHAGKTVNYFEIIFPFSSQQGKFSTIGYLNPYHKSSNKFSLIKLLFCVCNLHHKLPCSHLGLAF